MKAEFGLCLVCEKNLLETCPTCLAKKPGGQYSEVHLDLNNGSKMPVAVCHECRDAVHRADKEQIIDAVKEGWRNEQIKANWPREKIQQYDDHYKDLAIV